ncbi:MAG: TraB/GumN family protein, partial [Ferruginibacter sp.]
AQNGNSFLWRISQPGSTQNSYLFGTIHLPQEKFMLLADSVYAAVSTCKQLYTEINFDNITSELDDSDGFYQSKLNYLDSVKKTEAWSRMIHAVNRRYNTHINPDSLEQFTNFGNQLLADYMKPDPGVTALDMALTGYAKSLGKPCKGLETFKFQINMIYQLIDARLNDSTLLFDEDINLTKNLKRFYLSQQADSLTQLIEGVNKNYRKIIFDERNKTMADSIAAISVKQPVFFAVGCGHLLGENGIIALLRGKGFIVSPVFSDNRISITLMEQLFNEGYRTMKKKMKEEEEATKELKEDIMVAPPAPPKPPKTKTIAKPAAKKQSA